jgi:MATE family multidrug resistance protein
MTLSLQVLEEMVMLGKITGPLVVMGLLLYLRGMVSMMFLGYLGELKLAASSLSMGFTNISGYSVISRLAMGMDPICGQDFGEK